jgi:hypothetical protein
MNVDDLKNRFTYHPVVGDQAERYQKLREACLNLSLLINELAPDSREKSLAITHLEETSMMANAAIARNEQMCPYCQKLYSGTYQDHIMKEPHS